MSPPVHITLATEADAPHIAWAIRTAESSGTDVISYQQLFDLTDDELHELLTTLATEDAEGQELCYPTHWIARIDGEYAGSCAAWVEAADGMASHLIRAQLLGFVLGAQRLQTAADKLQIIAPVAIARTPGALQLESFAVQPAYRGLGIPALLIEAAIAHHREQNPELALAEIILMDNNPAALRAYQKAGFAEHSRTHSAHPQLPHLLPGTGKVLLRRELGVSKYLPNTSD